jgi:hypothetical protein
LSAASPQYFVALSANAFYTYKARLSHKNYLHGLGKKVGIFDRTNSSKLTLFSAEDEAVFIRYAFFCFGWYPSAATTHMKFEIRK